MTNVQSLTSFFAHHSPPYLSVEKEAFFHIYKLMTILNRRIAGLAPFSESQAWPLSKSRRKFRKAIKEMNKVLNDLKVEKHPAKTQINPISRGFDFLGYHLTLERLEPAKKTLKNAVSKACQLYEQGAPTERIDTYWRNFLRWLTGGLKHIMPQPDLEPLKASIQARYAMETSRSPSRWYENIDMVNGRTSVTAKSRARKDPLAPCAFLLRLPLITVGAHSLPEIPPL